MSLTPPMTTLTLGQNAPMPNRSSAAPTIYLATTDQPGSNVFLRRDFRPRADYTANHSSLG